MNDQIARAIANVVIFLEYSDDDIVDEDCAIQALERLAGDLRALDPDSRASLCESFRAIALTYDDEVRTFVEGLPEALGLEEQPEDEA